MSSILNDHLIGPECGPTSKGIAMAEFVVTWTVDLEADSPEHAARLALEMQRDPESTATVFDVLEWADQSHTASTTVEIDLDGPDARMEYLRGQIHAESIRMSEIAELQGYGADGLIPADDVELREWAGLPEFPDDDSNEAPAEPGAIWLAHNAKRIVVLAPDNGYPYPAERRAEWHAASEAEVAAYETIEPEENV